MPSAMRGMARLSWCVWALIPAKWRISRIWTPDQLQQWARGLAVTPVGRGSTNGFYGSDLVWTGSFNTPGTYYAIASQTGANPAAYALQISGDAVSFIQPATPANAEAAAETAAPAAVTTPAEETAAVEVKSGSRPNDALAPTNQWAPLAAGQQIWYAIPYSGDGAPIQVRFSADPSNAATFTVWTPDQIARSAEDADIQPVGRGSANDALGGDQAWAGSFNTPGTYYVVVSSSAAAPASYLLQVN